MDEEGSERRRAPREKAIVAAEVVTPSGRRRLGVVQDASAIGVQLLTHTRLSIGDRIGLLIQVDGRTQVDVDGTVARLEPTDLDGPWRFRVGVEIDPPSEELAEHARSIRERQQRGV